jgi:hypothetical protein
VTDDVLLPSAAPGLRSGSSPEPVQRIAGGWLGDVAPGAMGALGIALVSLASLCVTLLRRQRAQRLVTARVAARLATLAAPHEPA